MNRIKTAERNKQVVYNLTKHRFGFKDEKVIAQIAIAYSIQLNKFFSQEELDAPADNKGKEYPDTLLGEFNRTTNDSIYRVILNQHYSRKLDEDEFTKLIKLHMDHGLDVLNREILENNQGRNAHIDLLLSIINNGLSLVNPTEFIGESQTIKSSYTPLAFNGLIEVELGKDSESGEPVVLRINDENKFDSQHFAVAGMNGSGKTELVKDILYQINKQSEGTVKYVFFDYKGEGDGGKLKSFLDETNCSFIDIQKEAFDFNPLGFINISNERERNYHIKTFRDTIASIDKRIGVKQRNSLEIAIKNAFDEMATSGAIPTIENVYSHLEDYYSLSNSKEDTLTSIVRELSESIFKSECSSGETLLNQNTYINLPPTLPDVVRQASVFLILNYIKNKFIACDDVVASSDRVKPIRYVVVIDEAHAYLKQKNMASVLEDLLRMIRSKGVIVVMISQGVQEYKQKEFDFASQVKIPILLNVQSKDLKTAKSFLGTPANSAPLKTALNNLGSGRGIISVEEPTLLDINMYWQRSK